MHKTTRFTCFIFFEYHLKIFVLVRIFTLFEIWTQDDHSISELKTHINLTKLFNPNLKITLQNYLYKCD